MTVIACTLRSRREGNLAEDGRSALDMGFDAVALRQPLYHRDWMALRPLLPRESIIAVALFAPLPARLPAGSACPFVLGGLGREERRDAEKHAPATITFADENGIPYVLLPSVVLDAPPGRGPTTRRPDGERQARWDSYLGTIDRLLSAADRYQITCAITPAGTPRQLPGADETALCLAEFRGAPLCVWPDTAEHALAASLDPAAAAPWKRFEPIPGVTLTDLADGRVPCLPGEGALDWSGLTGELRAVPSWLLGAGADSRAGEALARALGLVRSHLERRPADPLFPGRSRAADDS